MTDGVMLTLEKIPNPRDWPLWDFEHTIGGITFKINSETEEIVSCTLDGVSGVFRITGTLP